MFASPTIRCGIGAVAVLAAASATPPASGPRPPVQLTSEEDHARTMALLGTTALRRGADGHDLTSRFFARYDESKVKP